MATKVLHYFGFGDNTTPSTQQPNIPDAPVRALPASWYNTEEMYQFERRAIFSRRWLLMTHSSRLKEPGDFLRYTVAGYDLIIIKDKTGKINSFHNVCRHRAYPVVEKDQGSAKILACRYHGWSYGVNGKLAKAPGFQAFQADVFDKEENGLFPIHMKIDSNGFVWINMDAGEEPEVPWDEHFKDVDIQERYKAYNFDDYVLDHTYELDGDYNWKILADNFNECLHCPTTHPDIPDFLNLESFDSDLKDGHIQHYCDATPEQVEKGLTAASTYYFPNASMTVAKHFLMLQKFLPQSAGKSTMTYEIYRNVHSTTAEFNLLAAPYARVMAEDKILCTRAQRNLNTGVFVNGLLHPKYEKAPIFFQDTVRRVVMEHWRREKEEGREVWAARRRAQGEKMGEGDEEVCEGIVGCGGRRKELAW